MSELRINQVDVAKLSVEPGDVLLVTTKDIVTKEIGGFIREAFRKAFAEAGGTTPPILVIDERLKVEIVRQDNIAARSGDD
jgi:hypothetical protein